MVTIEEKVLSFLNAGRPAGIILSCVGRERGVLMVEAFAERTICGKCRNGARIAKLRGGPKIKIT